MSWTDEEIDQLFRDRADKLSFEYKPEYWEEFSSSLSSVDLGGMSGDTHEVDQLYQLSANELTFEYKDAYWKEVEGMLPRRRRPDFLWLGTAVIFLGALTVGSFLSDNSAESDTLLASDAVETVGETQQTENTSQMEQNAPSVVNEPTFVQLDNGTIPTDLQMQTGEVDPSVQANTERAEVLNPVDIDPARAQQAAQETGSVPTPGEQIEQTEVNVSSGQEPASNNEHVENQTLAQESATMEKGEIGDLATRALSTPEAQSLAESNLPAVYDFKLPVSTGLYVEVNGGLSRSLITPSDVLSFSGGLGLGARFQKGRFVFNTGLNGQIGFHDDIVLNRQAKVYGFGSEVYRYTLKYDQMYTVEAVLTAGYRFGAHQINIGARPSYLMGTKVGVTMLEQEVESDRQTMYGHTEGLKRFGLKATLGYAVDLRSDFTLGVNLGVQTLKLVEEDFINGKNNTLPLDAQIYLRKGLRFRK